MLALSDDQLQILMTATGSVPVEKRPTFLERVAARLQQRGPHLTDKDLDDAVRSAQMVAIEPDREPPVRLTKVNAPL